MHETDITVVGGGIVGLSTAYLLAEKYPNRRLTLLEKEDRLAAHQTGRNSGVIHSGIYYKPGSIKALTCRRGKALLEEFCKREGVKFETCGKVIVAVDESEIPYLATLKERGDANGVDSIEIDQARLKELEPHVAGIRALHVRETGIIDYVGYCQKIGDKLRDAGKDVLLGHKVVGLADSGSETIVRTEKTEVRTKWLINCAGLYSDKVAEMLGAKPSLKIIPFRGEYYELVPEAHKFCQNLIYPVPDPSFPFLGVHFTRMVLGGVECGPNAVLAFGRESYKNTNLHLPELMETLGYPGFRKLASKFWKTGMGEMWRSYNKAAFVKALQRLVPEIQSSHIHSAPAGIRAQAVGVDGKLVDDFEIQTAAKAVHVLNAPSPAATACLAIAERIVEEYDSISK